MPDTETDMLLRCYHAIADVERKRIRRLLNTTPMDTSDVAEESRLAYTTGWRSAMWTALRLIGGE
jgi:predicted transcriptional regulator